MTLLEGEKLWNLIWILPLVFFLFYWCRRKRELLLKRFLGGRASDPGCVNSSGTLRFWRGALFLGVLVLLVVAAARPSWGIQILPYSGQGRDLMVVFDVSKSMLAQDVRPSRLEHAKWLARQLCTRNPGDRFGLIAFAGRAFLECPLTIDQTSFLQSVDELSTDTIPLGGTNIQQALTESIRGFRAAETPCRAVILITDGDELTGDSTRALNEIIKLKIPLFIFGIGDPAQPAIVQVPDGKGGIQTLKDRAGNVVSVALNEKMLAELARKTGGIYVRSTTTHPGIERVETRIKQLEKHDIDSGKRTRPIERPLYPLLGAFVLFCLWLMLGERKSAVRASQVKLLLVCGLAGVMLNAPGQTPGPAVEAKTPPAAEAAGNEKTAEKKPENLSPEELYNAGLKAQTQENDPGKAVQLYEQAIAAVNSAPEVRSRSAQNLGVMNHQKARALFQQAVQTVQTQQLDPALQQIDTGLKQLAVTENIYRDSLREGVDTRSVARNQHQLIRDRKKAEELKKKIEELKKKQQEARQNTQKAMDQQKQQNQKQNKQDKQQNQQDKSQQQQNQQNKQDQSQQNKQDTQQQQNQQNNQDKQQNKQNKQDQSRQGQKDKQQQDKQNQQDKSQQQQQQQNQQQTDKARESVRQLEQQARDLNQKKMEDQAKKAGEELDKARQAQRQNQDRKAEEHLKKALDQLGKEQDQQNKPDQNKQDQQKQDQQDKQDKGKGQKDQPKPDQQGKDKQLPKPGQGKPQNARPEPEKEINKEQAGALLDLMAGDEKKLKDELKARMKRNYGTRPVEKDW